MAAKPVRRKLPSLLDASTAGQLLTKLVRIKGKPVVLDAASVERICVPAIQILISVAATWRANGLELSIANPSEQFHRAIGAIGLPPGTFEIEE